MYLVQVAGGQTWKPHIDHLGQIDDSPQHEQLTEEARTNKDSLIRFTPSDMAISAGNNESTPTVSECTPTTH